MSTHSPRIPQGPDGPIKWLNPTAFILALTSLVAVWLWMAGVSRTDPWFRNTDMNMHNLADALAINASQSPNRIDQPGLVSKYLLALDGRIRHHLGVQPVWNLDQLRSEVEPLKAIPGLVRAGRVHERILIVLLIISAAGLVYTVGRNFMAACLTIILFCGSTGVLFQGLLTRPELHCVWFGNILALICVHRGTESRGWLTKYGWLFLTGLMVGLSALSKLPGICYLGVVYGWCWLAAITQDGPAVVANKSAPSEYWRGFFQASAGILVLAVVGHLLVNGHQLGAPAVSRLRIAALTLGLLPLLLLNSGRNRYGRFLVERGRELLLLIGGVLMTVPLAYLALRLVMSESSASTYLAGVLRYVIDPAATMVSLIDSPNVFHVLLQYLRQDLWLLLGSLTVLAGVLVQRSVSWRSKAFIALVIAGGIGMVLVLSKRHFTEYYGIFFQAPLLIALALGIHGFAGWGNQHAPGGPRRKWMCYGAFSLAIILLVGAFPRVRKQYLYFQKDSDPVVSEFTLTFIYDHDAHPDLYREIMAQHYGSREKFRGVLDGFLSDSANRF